jgi:hypothetical protein
VSVWEFGGEGREGLSEKKELVEGMKGLGRGGL